MILNAGGTLKILVKLMGTISNKNWVHNKAFDDFCKIYILINYNICYLNRERCLVVRCILNGGPLTGG